MWNCLLKPERNPTKTVQDYIDICFLNIYLTRCAVKNGIEALIYGY